MNQPLTVTVYGVPKPQGSKRAFVITPKGGGKPRAVVTEDSRTGARDWRTDVTNAVLEAMPYDWTRIEKPDAVHVTLVFKFDRPTSHYGSGRNAGVLKDSAPRFHTVKPDVDKLTRAILDGLTAAGVYADDSQVVAPVPIKRYRVDGEAAGLDIVVRRATLADLNPTNSAAPVIGEALTGATEPPPTDDSLF